MSKEKISHWFPRQTIRPCSAVQAAAHVLRCRDILEDEARIRDPEQQAAFIRNIDIIIDLLYRAERIERTGKMFSLKESGKLMRKFQQYSVLGDYHAITQKYGEDYFSHQDRKQKDFQQRSRRLIKNIPPSNRSPFDQMASAVRGYLTTESKGANHICQAVLEYIDMVLGGRAHQRDEKLIDRVFDVYSPLNGPKTVHDVLLALAIIRKKNKDLLDRRDEDMNTYQILIKRSFLHLEQTIRSYCKDVPKHIVEGNVDKDLEGVNERALEEFDIQLGHAIGLVRYFVRNNEEKLPPKAYAMLGHDINFMYRCIFFDYISRSPVLGRYFRDYPESLEDSFSEFEKNLRDYPRPTPDQIADSVIASIRKNKQGRSAENEVISFERQRASIPQSMEEVVDFYVLENEDYRIARREIFQTRKQKDGSDGPRTAFIKKIAKEHRQELLESGLSSAAIDEMRATGKIPLNDEGQSYNLTIEHIVDREIGGQNDVKNFILMHSSINAQKDKFKKKQIAAFKYETDGFWIITWQPRKKLDGSFPAVIPGLARGHSPTQQRDLPAPNWAP